VDVVICRRIKTKRRLPGLRVRSLGSPKKQDMRFRFVQLVMSPSS